MVYIVQNSQNFSGLFPSSCIPKNTTCLRLALSKGPNWVGVSSPTFTWGRKQIQFPKRRVFWNTGRWKKSRKNLWILYYILSVFVISETTGKIDLFAVTGTDQHTCIHPGLLSLPSLLSADHAFRNVCVVSRLLLTGYKTSQERVLVSPLEEIQCLSVSVLIRWEHYTRHCPTCGGHVKWMVSPCRKISVGSDCLQSQSHIAADGQLVCLGLSVLVSSPDWGSWPDVTSCLKVTVLSMWGALSDERSGLSFVSHCH
jgi:predicted RNA-binding Zn-ribbon protein involved in translation (DUF1610 family)